MPDEDILFTEDTIPFPQEGDQLFISGDDWYHNACLNVLHDNLDLYVTGYKEAGDRLVKSTMEDRSHQDALVFPTVFLYRQYIELRLKQLIYKGNQLLDMHSSFPKHHHIDKLWQECKSILKLIDPQTTDQYFDALERCILEFANADPSSTAFRYHIDKKDHPSVPDLRYINVRNLAEVMARIDSFLDAVYMSISVSIDEKKEMENVFRDLDYLLPEEYQ